MAARTVSAGQSSYVQLVPKYKNTIITETSDTQYVTVDNFEGPWVSYGWFEDNILNRFIGKKIRSSLSE